MKKILFVSYGGGHVKSLLPVAEKMQAMNCEVAFFALTTAINNLRKSDIKHYTYTDFFDTPEVQEIGKQLAGSIDANILPIHDTSIYLGQNYLDLVSEHGDKTAKRLYEESGRLIFNPLKSMTRVLLKLQPDLVVSTSSPRSEKAIIYAAGKLGIKSVVLSDLFVERPLSWFIDTNFSSKICVPSSFARDVLIENGRPSSDVVITGNPAFDTLVSASKAQKKSKKLSYRVLWASQPEPEYFAENDTYGDPLLPSKVESELIKIFDARRDWKLVIRNHPNEVPRQYPEFIESSNNDEKLSDLLPTIDLVVTCTSIVGFEALILGKGFITIDKSVLTPMLPFSKYGYSKGIDSIDSIEDHLIDYYSNNKDTNTPYNIENATDNVGNVILDLMMD